jgi:hypothetical protein
VRLPAEGEHETWYRSFVRIDAPQVGRHVFYGQINIGDRDGPIMGRSQVLYSMEIDESRHAVVMRGQPLENPERYVNLQDRPELWKEVRFRDASQIRCDFLWRRHGRQLRGLVEGATPERRKRGPGTCSYTMADGETEFVADSEWVLSPDELWIHDTNSIGGRQFLGRVDRTFTRFYRTAPFACEISDAAGRRTVTLQNRGGRTDVETDKGPGALRLLRAWYPGRDGMGLEDSTRLTIERGAPSSEVARQSAPGDALSIGIDAVGVATTCKQVLRFPAMPIRP